MNKNMDAWLLAKQAKLLSLECEMNGMIWENQYRLECNNTVAYVDHEFIGVSDQMLGISNEILARYHPEEKI